jgi:hypothetical protein
MILHARFLGAQEFFDHVSTVFHDRDAAISALQ